MNTIYITTPILEENPEFKESIQRFCTSNLQTLTAESAHVYICNVAVPILVESIQKIYEDDELDAFKQTLTIAAQESVEHHCSKRTKVCIRAVFGHWLHALKFAALQTELLQETKGETDETPKGEIGASSGNSGDVS